MLPTETTLAHYTIGHVADKGGGMGWDDCGSRGGGGLQSKLVRACARLIRQGLIILSHVTLDAVQVGAVCNVYRIPGVARVQAGRCRHVALRCWDKRWPLPSCSNVESPKHPPRSPNSRKPRPIELHLHPSLIGHSSASRPLGSPLSLPIPKNIQSFSILSYPTPRYLSRACT